MIVQKAEPVIVGFQCESCHEHRLKAVSTNGKSGLQLTVYLECQWCGEEWKFQAKTGDIIHLD